MKFLLDQDVYATTIRFLRVLGHDVTTASQLSLSRADDLDLLKVAHQQDQIFVTRDRDFGALVFLREMETGVIYLRILPSTVQAVHRELERVLQTHSEEALKKAFVVIEPGRYRFRKLSVSG